MFVKEEKVAELMRELMDGDSISAFYEMRDLLKKTDAGRRIVDREFTDAHMARWQLGL